MDIYTVLSSAPHNTHHLNRYIKFIEQCIEFNSCNQPTYFEGHHICPKSMFPKYKSLSKNLWNRADLTPRQHFIAHHMLAMIYSNRQMISAFFRMVKTSERHSKNYAKLKLSLSIKMKEHNPMHDPIIVEKARLSGLLSWTPERRKLQSESRTGVCNLSEAGKRKLSELWKGVSRPKSCGHIQNHRKSVQTYEYITPYGIFISSTEAAKIIGVSNVSVLTRCRRNEVPIKNSRSLSDKSLIGKTWKELGYSIRRI